MPKNNFVIVETEYGPVEGVRSETVLGLDVIKFQGIPYMKDPIGKLRFRDAEAPEKWTVPLKATRDIGFPAQNFVTLQIEGQEDAGIVNVYTKNVQPGKLYPVMVWIHGGGFQGGSSKIDIYGPDFILQKDVVFVSINYRLGPFGFLSLSDPTLGVPGNAGLKDQTFALKWIQRNIKKFGGDPDHVTLFGESAGGASVHFHMISNQSKGLFKRAIPQSGVALNYVFTLQPHRDYAQRLAKNLDYTGPQDDKSVLEFLEGVDAYTIVKACDKILTTQEKREEKIGVSFAPQIEPYQTANSFITKDPLLMMREAWSSEMDILIGCCSNEGLLRAFDAKDDSIFESMKNVNTFTPIRELGLTITDLKAETFGKILKQVYYGLLTPSKTNLEGFFSYSSDFYFLHGIERTITSRAKHAKTGKTFFYRCDVLTSLNVFKKFGKVEDFSGTEHGGDLFYLFKTQLAPLPSIDSKEFQNIKKFVAMWTNFAIHGDPNCSEMGDVEWKPITSPELPLKCLNIGTDKLEVIEFPESERLAVWNSIYKQAGVDLI